MEPHEAVVAIIIPTIAILGFVGLMILLRKFTNDERMAMIEKGWTLPPTEKSKVNPASALRWGCLLVGVGLGIFIANFIASVKQDHEALYPALIMFFGGAGLLVSYFIQLKIDERGK
jgi:cytochrome c oxidase subunit IV